MVEITEGATFELVNETVLKLVERYTFEMVSQITLTTAGIFQAEFEAWVLSGGTLPELMQGLSPYLGPVRAEMVAITEVTRLYAVGNLEAWRASGVVDEVDWMTAEDEIVCAVCEPLGDHSPTPINSPDFNGYLYPPAHVRCRCWLRPVIRAKLTAQRWALKWKHSLLGERGLPKYLRFDLEEDQVA